MMDRAGKQVSNDPRKAAMCYIPFLGWMPSVAFLVLEHDKGLRKHAVQSLLMHALLAGVYWVAVPFLSLTVVLAPAAWMLSGIVGVVFLIFMLWSAVKVNEGGEVRVPIVGEWVEKIVK